MTAERSPQASPPAVPGGFAFPATRRSVIERLRDPKPERRRLAFGDLALGYWKPLCKHFRLRWRLEPADAEDAVQGLLAEAWEGAWFDGYDPARARFPDEAPFAVNGARVHGPARLPSAAGQLGLRIGDSVNVHVTRLSIVVP